ncbi:hypothetical protein BJV78DRAFT_147475 [Lactifluus subvellereus]|nr:hypothetical protein BJV78DRAFT_147475 [Lactifluus subvellereus]
MLSILLPKMRENSPAHAVTHRSPPVRQPRNDGDLTFRSWQDGHSRSPIWSNPASSPMANLASISLSSESTISSRESWSSLFNSNVRQPIGGGSDSARDGGHTVPAIHKGDPEGILVPGKHSRNLSDVNYHRMWLHSRLSVSSQASRSRNAIA